MINFTLSNYYNGLAINKYFLFYIKKYQKYLKDPNIAFNQIECELPFDTWNGGQCINSNNNLLLNTEIDSLITNFKERCIRLNCSNLYLENFDFLDNYHNVLLPKLDVGSTAILLSNLKLYDYLKNKYNFSKYILSSNAAQFIEYTPDIINTILDNTDFQLIQLPFNLNKDFDFLYKIKDLNRIEICINPICSSYCKNISNCLLSENNFILNFSEKSNYLNCIKIYKYDKNPNILSLETLKNDYISCGITHFNLATCPINQLPNYLIFLINYFFDIKNFPQILEEPWIEGISALRDPEINNFITSNIKNY